MDKNKLYYLAHPFTTYGNETRNLISSRLIARWIRLRYGISVLNPLVTVPQSLTWDDAMYKCGLLLDACDAIIMSGQWQKSKGCIDEYEASKFESREVLFYQRGCVSFESYE
jgi:hypothetical protein